MTMNKENFFVGTGNYKDLRDTKGERKMGFKFVLNNGDELTQLIKRAQQQSAELDYTLKCIKEFTPRFDSE
ncbi:hypothetical protein IV37_GL000036 [Fructilactobacillus fructivorans]|nr:hypothetical protein FC73_GL000033 [Fructilactobacillus fructivorans]KRN13324.1 hypothetical protein IV37_GL000036 [Fructilactobacillus fructivorans]